jgi:peptidoglycan hydrolase-like protein with peptidoglycan-binding domain
MNVALSSRGYKRADQGTYRAFQAAAGLVADGYPGRGTMGKLAAVIATVPGISLAPVQVYPWHNLPGTSGYDGVNAPTWQEWTGQALPTTPPPPPPPVVPPPPFTNASAPSDPATTTAVAMNSALLDHGYNRADQPLYRAFQAAVGLTADGYPGRGTMGKLAAVLGTASVPMAPVQVFPWHTRPGTSGYDGTNAPAWAQWTAPIGAGVAA